MTLPRRVDPDVVGTLARSQDQICAANGAGRGHYRAGVLPIAGAAPVIR
jgi:hypothetical protein